MDPELSNGYDIDRMVSAIIEIVAMCAGPVFASTASVTSPGPALSAEVLQALGTAIGAATAGAIGAGGAGRGAEARAAVKMDSAMYRRLVTAYEKATDRRAAGRQRDSQPYVGQGDARRIRRRSGVA